MIDQQYLEYFLLGTCPCQNRTTSRCACGEFWCSQCLPRHTSAPGGRCPAAIALEQKIAKVTQ